MLGSSMAVACASRLLDAAGHHRSYWAMQTDRPSPPKSPRRSAAEARREREAEALRANLRKRKEQQRARETPDREVLEGPSEDPAGG